MVGIAVVGAGPGIGTAVAARFAREGMPVGLIARSEETLARAASALSLPAGRVTTAVADASDAEQLRGALKQVTDGIGLPDVIVYNAARIRMDTVEEVTAADLVSSWEVNVGGAVTTAAAMLPALAARGRGTFLLTGGMPTAVPSVVSLSLGKAALRALTDLLAAQYGPSGIHVATVTIGGPVARGTRLDPDEIADLYWDLHREEPGSWRTRVEYDGPAT